MSERRPRIAFFCVSMRAGGTERVIARYANHLARRFDVSIVTLAFGPVFYDLDSNIQIIMPANPRVRSDRFSKRLGSIRHLISVLRARKPDIALVFGEDIGGVTCLACAAFKVKRILVFNRGTPSRSLRGLPGLINPIVYRYAQHMVVQTARARDALKDRYRGCNLFVLPNPVEPCESVPLLADRPKVIINVGSIGRKKNQAALLRAFAGAEGREQWRLVFVGDGPERLDLEREAHRLGLSGSVDFLGVRDDVSGLLNSAQIFAFTSLAEGFPNALAEALAAGCACISYNCPAGPSDLIENGRNGILVELNNEDAFRMGLEQLMTDSGLRENISGRAQVDIRRFDSNKVLKEFEELVTSG